MNTEERDWLLEMKSDMRHMLEWAKTHTQNEDKRHEDNLKKFEDIRKNEVWQNKILYGLIGVFIFVEFAIKLFKEAVKSETDSIVACTHAIRLLWSLR